MARLPDTSFWDAHLAEDAAPWGHLPTVTAEETWWRLRGTGARRVLVAGCAYGRHVGFFARKGFDVAGIDASQVAIDRAHEAALADGLEISLTRASITRMPFSDASFDAIYDHSLLHHLSADERPAAVAEYHRVLRVGGLLVVSVLSTDDPEFGIGPEIEPATFRAADDRLEHFFDAEELRELLDTFEVESLIAVSEPAEWEASGDPRRFVRAVARRKPIVYGPHRLRRDARADLARLRSRRLLESSSKRPPSTRE